MRKLTKKEQVQKVARISPIASLGLEILSEKFNRTQNDLFNHAINGLLEEHSEYLEEYYFCYKFKEVIDFDSFVKMFVFGKTNINVDYDPVKDSYKIDVTKDNSGYYSEEVPQGELADYLLNFFQIAKEVEPDYFNSIDYKKDLTDTILGKKVL